MTSPEFHRIRRLMRGAEELYEALKNLHDTVEKYLRLDPDLDAAIEQARRALEKVEPKKE